MGKKMKLIPFLFKPTEPVLSSSSSWPWPNCGNPKTLSFRAETIMDSTIESRFINSSVCELSAGSIELEEDEYSVKGFDQSIENVIRGVRSSSNRLLFHNHTREITSCILGDQHMYPVYPARKGFDSHESTTINKNDCVTSENSYICGTDNKVVLMEMDSRDPFEDFKKSMEEMVEANGFNMKDDWDSLHQLLSCYLKVNCKSNHGYIVGAFIDLLVSLEYSSASNSSFSPPTSSSSCENDRNSSSDSSSATVITQSPISALSFSSNCSTGPCLLNLFEEEEEDDKEDAGLDHFHSSSEGK